MKKNNADRRNFIKNATVLGFGVPVSLATISQAQANTSSISNQSIVNSKENLRPLCKKENNQKSDNYNLQDFINYLKKYKITPTQNPYGIEFLQY